MKVLFVVPKWGEYSGGGKSFRASVPHIGVAYMMGFLDKQGIKTKVIDMSLKYSVSDLLAIIDSYEADLVGVTSYSWGHKKAYEIVDAIKAHDGNIKVVIGGPHVSVVHDTVLSQMSADFAVKGEGEFTMLELCRLLEKHNENYEEVKGLIWRDGDDIVENKDRSWIQDLDSLPYPAFEKFELKEYLCHDLRVLPIITSRGCPYSCTYCSVKLVMGQKFRPRSPENVVDELEFWYNKGWKNFNFDDDNFTFDMDRAMKICDLIIERELKIQFKLYNGIRVDRVSKELLQRMKEAGCVFIAYGIESGNREVLKRMKKGITPEQIAQAIKWTNEVGIENRGSCIVGHPGETFEKFMETVRFVEGLPTGFVNFFNLIPYPGTEVYKWVKNNAKLLYPEDVYLNDFEKGQEEPIFETDDFPLAQRKIAIRMGRRLYKKLVLKHKLGRRLGYLAYQAAKIPLLWKIGTGIFKGSRTGTKMYSWFLRRRSIKTTW